MCRLPPIHIPGHCPKPPEGERHEYAYIDELQHLTEEEWVHLRGLLLAPRTLEDRARWPVEQG